MTLLNPLLCMIRLVRFVVCYGFGSSVQLLLCYEVSAPLRVMSIEKSKESLNTFSEDFKNLAKTHKVGWS